MLTIRFYRFTSIFFAAVCSLFVFSGLLVAQLPTGTFLGVVKDSTGAVIPSATVTIQSTETNEMRTAMTDATGSYRVPALPVGRYNIKVEASGFRTTTDTGLDLQVGQEAVVDFTLLVGTSQQTVQVTGEALLVNTTNSTLSSVVSEDTMTELPLNGRNYTDLTLLQPGITQLKSLSNAGGNQPGTVYSSNGGQIQSNWITLDGAPMVSTYDVSAASGTGNELGLDGIREYQVITSNFSAQYVMTMGSQTVLVSKSGTNDFHGDAFEFIRNDVLDGANYFDEPTVANHEERTPPFKRNQFGGSLGGPVQKNKTFFFAAYEGLREDIGQTTLSPTVPADCFGATNNPCASLSGGVVTPAALQVLQLFPQPNLVGPNNTPEFTYPATEPVNENWGQGRIDRTFSSKDTAFARYTFDDSYYQYGLEFPPFTTNQATRAQFVTLGENHLFSTGLLNTFRFSFSRTASTMESPSAYGSNYPSLVPNAQIPGFGTFLVSGLTSINTGAGAGLGPTATQPNFPRQNIWSYSDDLFWEKGKHSLKFGTLINHYQNDYYDYDDARGQLTVNSLANLLAGQLASVGVIYYTKGPTRHFRNDTYGFYAQDDYKVLRTLTLNLGLRYEFATEELDNDGLNFHSGPITCDYPCFPVGQNYQPPYYHDFSPRIGFAWDVFGNGKTSLRGGGALLYDTETLGSSLQGLLQSLPFSNTVSLGATTLTIPLNVSAAVPGLPSAGGIAYNIHAPRLYEWNLTAERQLPWQTAIEVTYVGSRGIHVDSAGDGNPIIFQIQNGQPFWPASDLVGNTDRVVTDTGWYGFPNGQGANSYYEALEISVTKRLSNSLRFQSEYTYSKLIDDDDGSVPSQSDSTSNAPISSLDLRLDRSLASYDTRNNYRLNTIYNLPTTNASNSFERGVLNGWWTAIIFAAQDGYPFTPSVASNRSRSGGPGGASNLDRPDWLPGRNAYNATHGVSPGCKLSGGGTIPVGAPLGGPALYFDPCAFTLAPVGYEGDVARNGLIGPGLLDLDFSLVKDTAAKWLGEAGKVEFRAEFFNILNHPNLAEPTRTEFTGSLTDGVNCPITGCPVGTESPSATAGLITSTATGTTATQASGNSRQIQFGLKFVF